MRKRKRRNNFLKELIENGTEAFKAANADRLAGNQNSKSKRRQQNALEHEGPDAPRMVNIDCSVLVRITRLVPYKKPLDDDNFIGGCKELRDAIAEALGRSGDSETDGMHWEYVQEIGPTETRIEIFEHEQTKATN